MSNCGNVRYDAYLWDDMSGFDSDKCHWALNDVFREISMALPIANVLGTSVL